jgi:hypothetical protein
VDRGDKGARATREPRRRLIGLCTAGALLIVHEDTPRGSLGERLAALIQEEVFEYLDAPIRVLGALDAPVPYSPALERAFLLGEHENRKRRPSPGRLLIAGSGIAAEPMPWTGTSWFGSSHRHVGWT